MPKQPAGEDAVLFNKTRLKSYHGRLNSTIDPKLVLSNTVALAPDVLFGAVTELATEAAKAAQDAGPEATATSLHSKAGKLHLTVPWNITSSTRSNNDFTTLQDGVNTIKSEIAGVECVLAHLKGCDDISTLGRKSPIPVTKQQLVRRAELVTQSLNSFRPQQYSTNATQRSSTNSEPNSPCLHSRGTSASPGLQQLQTGNAQSNVSDRGFDTLLENRKDGTHGKGSWQRNNSVVPVGRGEAIILESALDEALPAGAITAKYGSPAQRVEASLESYHTSSARGRNSPQRCGGSPAAILLSSQDIREDWELLNSVLKEAARQVSATCTQRGQLILKVCDRYQEVFGSMSAMVQSLHTANTWLTTKLKEEGDTMKQQAEGVQSVQEALRAKQMELDNTTFQLVSTRTELEHTRWDMQQHHATLTEQNNILARKVDELSQCLEQMRTDHEVALAQETDALQSQLMEANDVKDDLATRIRFLEKRIVAMKQGGTKLPDTVTQGSQTEAVEWYEEEDDKDVEGLTCNIYKFDRNELQIPVATQQAPRRRRRWSMRPLGGFEGMITSSKQGRVRGLHWTQTVLQQIYQDKIVQDAVADRDCNPRRKICEVTLDWHLQKFGLLNLAESNLLDLIASVRHYADTVPRVAWYARFTGLSELSPGIVDTTQHVSFYLFLLQQLAFPNALTCLFPDNEGDKAAQFSVTSLPEVTKAVFRYLNDPEAAASFMAYQVENMMETNQAAKGPAHVPLDELIRLLMSEFQLRYDRATSHLSSLFKAGDVANDGVISYDAFSALVDIAAPDAPARLKASMFGEAIRQLPSGQHLIPCSIWVAVARTFGFDRWKVDTSALASQLPGLRPPSPGQLLGQGPGVLPLLAGLPSASYQAQNGTVTLKKGSGQGTAVSRRPESARSMDTGILAMLYSSLSSMKPTLPDMIQQATIVLHEGSSTLKHIRAQTAHLGRALLALPDLRSSQELQAVIEFLLPDPAAREAAIAAGGNGFMKQPQACSDKPSGNIKGVSMTTISTRGSNTSVASQDQRRSLPVITQPAGNQAAANTNTSTAVLASSGAAHAWLAFQMLYSSLTLALSPGRPASRAAQDGFSTSCPGSPSKAASRRIIQPAMPWRSGRVSRAGSPMVAEPQGSRPQSQGRTSSPGRQWPSTSDSGRDVAGTSNTLLLNEEASNALSIIAEHSLAQNGFQPRLPAVNSKEFAGFPCRT